jgi:hypothetical protein
VCFWLLVVAVLFRCCCCGCAPVVFLPSLLSTKPFTPSQKQQQTNSYFTALLFKVSGIELTAIEGDLCANMMVVSLVAGLNVGAYLGFLWLLVPQE